MGIDVTGIFTPSAGPKAFPVVAAEDILMQYYPGDPNTNVTGRIGEFCWDTVNDDMYVNTDGAEAWDIMGGGGAGASTALDNLASVAINTSLISDTDSEDDLGSSSIRWANVYGDVGHFAAIKDTGGTTRIVIATSGYHLVFDSRLNMTFNDNVVSGADIMVNIAPTVSSMAGEWDGIVISPIIFLSGNTRGVHGLVGNALVFAGSGSTGHTIDGLNFNAVAIASNITATFTSATGMEVLAQGSAFGAAAALTITSLTAGKFKTQLAWNTPNTLIATDVRGVWIVEPVHSGGGTIVNYYGLHIEDYTGGSPTINALLEVGPTIPSLRVQGNHAVTDFETAVYIAADDPSVLRQITVGADNSGDSGFRVLQIPNI